MSNPVEQQDCKHSFVKRKQNVMGHEKSVKYFHDVLLIRKCEKCGKRETVDILKRVAI